MNKSNRNNIVAILTIAAALIALGAWYSSRPQQKLPNLDAFAECLREKGVVMYGAEWCPHCQSEKKAFGDSFRLVPYVECPAEPKKCLDLGVDGYPTWILGDGKRLVGEQGLQKLSEASGCPLSDVGESSSAKN